MIYDSFSERFGFLIGVGIRSFGWMGGFFEGSFVDWASFEVSSMLLSAKYTLGGTLSIFRTHFCKVVFTTFNAFRFVTTVISRVSVGLTIVALWWATSLFVWFLNQYFSIE